MFQGNLSNVTQERNKIMNDIPIINVTGSYAPEVFERLCLEVWSKGARIKTEYGGSSLDVTAMVTIKEPTTNPRLHKNLCVGYKDLEVYKTSILEGIDDYQVEAGVYTYTYSRRLTKFHGKINQIEAMIDKLVEAPFSRRAQAITWDPTLDIQEPSPPCLQRIWCRLTPANDRPENGMVLNMNVSWRSRDLWKAFLVNIYGLTSLMECIAQDLSVKLEIPVVCGRYVEFIDSLHIYEADWNVEEIKKMQSTPWTYRAVKTTDREYVEEIELAKEDIELRKAKAKEFYRNLPVKDQEEVAKETLATELPKKRKPKIE